MYILRNDLLKFTQVHNKYNLLNNFKITVFFITNEKII